MAEDNWANEKPIDLRTKLALKVLLLIFKVLSPYRFANEFEADIKALTKSIEELK